MLIRQSRVYWLLSLSEDLREGLKINKGPLLANIDSLHFWLPVGLQEYPVSASVQSTNSTKIFDALYDTDLVCPEYFFLSRGI